MDKKLGPGGTVRGGISTFGVSQRLAPPKGSKMGYPQVFALSGGESKSQMAGAVAHLGKQINATREEEQSVVLKICWYPS